MSMHLQIVHPARDPQAWFWSGANPADAPRPRVLCEETNRRLALMNVAVRALRELGVRIAGCRIDGEFPAEDGPSIRIERDPCKPFGAFLDAAGPRRWMALATEGRPVTTAACVFMGVWVIWEEAQ